MCVCVCLKSLHRAGRTGSPICVPLPHILTQVKLQRKTKRLQNSHTQVTRRQTSWEQTAPQPGVPTVWHSRRGRGQSISHKLDPVGCPGFGTKPFCAHGHRSPRLQHGPELRGTGARLLTLHCQRLPERSRLNLSPVNFDSYSFWELAT